MRTRALSPRTSLRGLSIDDCPGMSSVAPAPRTIELHPAVRDFAWSDAPSPSIMLFAVMVEFVVQSVAPAPRITVSHPSTGAFTLRNAPSPRQMRFTETDPEEFVSHKVESSSTMSSARAEIPPVNVRETVPPPSAERLVMPLSTHLTRVIVLEVVPSMQSSVSKATRPASLMYGTKDAVPLSLLSQSSQAPNSIPDGNEYVASPEFSALRPLPSLTALERIVVV